MKREPNLERLDLWVAGLESDEFNQGRYTLTQIRTDGTRAHCCLGVACEIAIRNGLQVNHTIGGDCVIYDGSTGSLPDVVADWYGITPDPVLARRDGPTTNTASYMNDGGNATFKQIADAIRFTFIDDTPDAVARRRQRR